MHAILFGIETEYSLGVWPREEGRRGPSQAELVEELLYLARRNVSSLPDRHPQGVFLANGSRFYIDIGLHPELSTPECRSPEELVRWALAGDRLIADCAAELDELHPDCRIAVFRCNVDYGSQSTWGCHESYAIQSDPGDIADHLISHLATRIVFAGAGGFSNLHPKREFLLSPRVPHMKHAAVLNPTRGRALIHDRHEPLCDSGLHRLHLMCGESLCSQRSNFLKLGTTALVIRLAELGLSEGRRLSLSRPLQSMRAFSRDPRCRRRARLKDGRLLSAVDIQRLYLENVERNLDNGSLPSWAASVCRVWREVLDMLEADPELLATSLDWAIKRALFRRREQQAAREGRATSWGELCELDIRFGELGDRGLFSTLDRAGVLEHQLDEIGSVEAAVNEPPPGGRAEARGRAIQELQPGGHYVCNWDGIFDTRRRRILAMGDPFSPKARWRDVPDEELESVFFGQRTGRELPWEELRQDPAIRHRAWTRRLNQGIDACNQLRLGEAGDVLWDCVVEAAGDPEDDSIARFWFACAAHDFGDVQEAVSVLGPALQLGRHDASSETVARVWTRMGLALIEWPRPLAQIVQHLEEAEAVCQSRDPAVGRSRLQLLRGRLLIARGLYAEAIPYVERALEASHADPIAFSPTSHWRWLVHASVRLRDWEQAYAHLERWKDELRTQDIHGQISVRVAESGLYLGLGQLEEALRLARSALECSCSNRDNRYRAAACCAFLSAAIASGELADSRDCLREALRWRWTHLGELRYEVRRVQLMHVLSRELRRSGVGQNRLVSSDELPIRSRRAWQAALREGRMLDGRLESTHRASELARWVVAASTGRSVTAGEQRHD